MNDYLNSIIKRDPAARDKISIILTYPGVKAVFLGHYFKWDPQHTFEVAKRYGFKGADEA